MHSLPIGIFDSGLGGLTVVKELIAKLPNEDFIYLGDTARVPYGTRSKEIIKKFSLEDAKFLVGKKVKCIIIACNTASSIASTYIQKKIDIPVFDVIKPTLNYVNKISMSVGVIGTIATVNSKAYKVKESVACPLFVPFIEENEINSQALKLVAKNYLKNFKKIDTLILGCTHYPIIEKLIQKIIGKKIKLVNPEKIVVKEVKQYLNNNKLLNSSGRIGKREFYVTDINDRFINVAEMFLGQKIKPNLKKVII